MGTALWYQLHGHCFAAAIAVSIGFSAMGLWIGRYAGSWAIGMERGTYYCDIPAILITAAVAGVAYLVPWTGYYLGTLATWLLLWTLTEAEPPEMSVTITFGCLASFAGRLAILLGYDSLASLNQ